jgi:hypothetical protein
MQGSDIRPTKHIQAVAVVCCKPLSHSNREATTDKIDGLTLNTSSVGDLFRHLSGSIGPKQNISTVNLTVKLRWR